VPTALDRDARPASGRGFGTAARWQLGVGRGSYGGSSCPPPPPPPRGEKPGRGHIASRAR
jgi:hypothetical protein